MQTVIAKMAPNDPWQSLSWYRKEISYNRLADAIMQAEKFHGLLYGSGKPRKADGIVLRPSGSMV